MLAVYAKSMAATLATVAPLLLVYWRWKTPADLGLVELAGAAILGCLGWAAVIFLVRHPVRHEITGLLGTAREAISPSLRFGRG
jgi:hypothetical protein